MRMKNISGQRFGNLVAKELLPERAANGSGRWTCLCDCGSQTVVIATNLRSGHTVSCGCRWREVKVTHGMRNTPEFEAWNNMLQRCTNPNNPTYQYYGARGVTVCPRWMDSFENFYADMGPRPSVDHSIERRDVNGNYEPNNCYWATAIEQANNRRNNVTYVHQGEIKTQSQLAKEHGVGVQTLRSRLDRGIPLEEALSKLRLPRK